MEAFLASYCIPFQEFRELMMSTNSLVAGSSALALYMKQIGQEPGFVPNDIDIWMEDNNSIFLQNGHYNQRSNVSRFYQFLTEKGYHATPKFANRDNPDYYDTLHLIKNIYSMINPAGKEIQLIVVSYSGLLHYITKYFDLTICMTWWDAMYDQFKTVQPETTNQRIMLANPERIHDPSNRIQERITKYTARGFNVGVPPPLCAAIMDDRVELDDVSCTLKDITAFDVWAYDDVNVIEFLKASPWNMLLKIGTQWQAFHRKHLYDFMKSRRTHFAEVGDVYDTPHNQTVTVDAFNVLLMGDYTIFELEQRYTITQGTLQKTLYDVHCYTVREWNEGNSEVTLAVPDRQPPRNMQPRSSPPSNVQRQLVFDEVDEDYERERQEAALFQQLIFDQIAQGR